MSERKEDKTSERKADLVTILDEIGTPAKPRAMYAWEAGKPLDNPQELCDFCEENGINLLFVSGSSLSERADDYKALISAAHSRDINVHALMRRDSWSECSEGSLRDAFGLIDSILGYNTANPNGSFDGIYLDIEPWALKKVHRLKEGKREIHDEKHPWSIRMKEIFPKYLALIKKSYMRLRSSGSTVQLGVEIPCWFESVKKDGKYVARTAEFDGKVKPVNQHLLDIVDYAVVTAYFDDPQSIIRLVHEEIGYAAALKKKVFVGINCNDGRINCVNPKNSFWKDGKTQMVRAMKDVEGSYKDREGFAGIAVHSYRSFRTMSDKPNPELVKGIFDRHLNDLLEAGKKSSREGRFDEALDNFNTIIRFNPKHKWARYNKGKTLRDIGRLDEAFVCFKRAVEVNPDTYTHSALAEELLKRGEYKEAKKYLDSALELDQQKDHQKDHQNAHAIKTADMLPAEYDPSSLLKVWGVEEYTKTDTLIALGNFFKRRGEESTPYFEKAKKQLMATLKRDYQDSDAISLIGEHPDGSELLDLLRAPEVYKDEKGNYNYRALHQAGKALHRWGEHDDSIRYFNFLIKRFPDIPWAHLEKAKPLHESGRTDEAIVCCERELEINPHYTYAYNDLGWYYIKQKNPKHKDFEMAEQALKEAIRIDPNNEWAYHRLGVCYYDQKRYGEAVVPLEESVRLWSENELALCDLGKCYLGLDRREEAKSAFQRAKELGNKWAEEQLAELDAT